MYYIKDRVDPGELVLDRINEIKNLISELEGLTSKHVQRKRRMLEETLETNLELYRSLDFEYTLDYSSLN